MNQETNPQIVRRQAIMMTKSQAVINAETLAFKRLDDLLARIKCDMLEVTRRLTDWSSMAVRLHHLGPVLISTLEAPQYLLDCRQIIISLRDIPSDIIIIQFNFFIHRLHKETKNMDVNKIKKTDSKDLIFKNVEDRFRFI